MAHDGDRGPVDQRHVRPALLDAADAVCLSTLRCVGSPFQTTIAAFESAIHVVVGRVSAAGVGLRQRQLVMDVRMSAAQGSPARGANATGLFVTVPTHHRTSPSLKVVLQDFCRSPADFQSIVHPDSLAPIAITAGLRRQEMEERVPIPFL